MNIGKGTDYDAEARRLVRLAYDSSPAFVDEMEAFVHTRLMEALMYTMMRQMANTLALIIENLEREDVNARRRESVNRGGQ